MTRAMNPAVEYQEGPHGSGRPSLPAPARRRWRALLSALAITIGSTVYLSLAASPQMAAGAIRPGLALGSNHSCALVANGSLQCWGNNDFGQMARGTLVVDAKTKKPLKYDLPNGSTTPTAVANLAGIPQLIGAGGKHTCAALLNGITRCWGYNDYGQLGKDTGMTVGGKLVNLPCVNLDAETQAICGVTPTPVQNLGGAPTDLTGGEGHTCGLFGNGTVKCWGGTNSYSTAAQLVEGLATPATAISGGRGHTCALLGDGGVSCWGDGGDGQIGKDDFNDSRTPVSVGGLGAKATQVSSGDFHTCALLDNASIKCWGLDDLGQLGDGRLDTTATPVTVEGLAAKPISIASGGRHTCALLEGGSVQCWGSNREGQVGAETGTGCWGFKCSTAPVVVQGLSGPATAIWSGGTHSCVSLENGRVQCWGSNQSGQLGAVTTGGCPRKDLLVDIPCSKVPVTVPGLNLTRPAPDVTARPAALTNIRSSIFGFSQLSGATFTCSVDAGPPTPCGTRFTTASLVDGRHTLEVKAVTEGVTSEPTTASWTVDATAPVLRSRSRTKTRTQTIYRFVMAPDASGFARVEYSTSKKAPATNARNVPGNTAAYRSPLAFRTSATITWIRFQDKAGNWSRWSAG